MGWVKGSDRNFEASQTERYERQRKTEENVERRPVVTPRYESALERQRKKEENVERRQIGRASCRERV